MSDNTMNATHEIIILQLCADLPLQLRDSLVSKGFPTTVTTETENLSQKLAQASDPILMAACGEDLDFAFECTKKLVALKDLHKYPLIQIGKDVDSYENILNKNFSLAITLSTPCAIADILEALNYAVRSYPKLKQEEGVKLGRPTVSEAIRISENPKVDKHPTFDNFKGIPELFFGQLSSLKLSKDGIGGLIYPKTINDSVLQIENYLPKDSKFQQAAKTTCLDAGKWGRLHLLRVAYIADCISKALGFSEEEIDKVRACSFLYPAYFVGENADLLRREYHEPRFSALRRELCSKIKDSAMYVAVNLQSPEIGNLISLVGKVIGKESSIDDSSTSIIASIIVGADLTDRICYQAGHWNPRKAYLLMQKIRSEQVTDIHPRVLCAVVKFLSEAMTSHPHAFVVPKSLRVNPRLQKLAQEWKEQKVKANEKKVPLVNLMPGMKLSRPVITYDGREILSGDLTLDDDLILRLWQLSSIRPVNGPLVVFSEN